MSSFVVVSNLSKSYNGLRAVDDISFEIPEGSMFGLLGPNGAGKTTAISMLSGLIRPDDGNISIGGYDMLREPMKAKSLMGIVPQEIALYPTLSARENLMFWGRLYRLSGKNLRTRVEEVLTVAGLSERANDSIEKYSGGMKRRINIAAGLLHNPKLLLLDEPTVGVDPQSRRSILDTITDLNRQGMTVIYTSHYMEEVEELCPLVTIMDRGKIIASGERHALMQMVEDRDVIRLETAKPLENYDNIKKLPNVIGVSGEENVTRITVGDSRKLLAPVIEAINKSGIQVTSVTVEQPNLETVFLHLTGRNLRN